MIFTSAPGISISQACLRFQRKCLFENLSFTLPAGTITCLLGASGVGKTSLLRMLAGLPLFGRGTDKLQALPALRKNTNRSLVKLHDEGVEISVNEAESYHTLELGVRERSEGMYTEYMTDAVRACNNAEKSLWSGICAHIATTDGLRLTDRVAYMGQSDLLLRWLSVLDNVLLGSYLRGEKRNRKIKIRAQEILASVGLGEEIHDKPDILSGGMKQRAALARTLMEDKPVVLMDEPFSALDAITRYDMQTLAAKRLAGKTVFLITHDPWEALRLGHQILVLRGQPAQLATPVIPPEGIPRDLTHPALLPLQKQLLTELQMVHP